MFFPAANHQMILIFVCLVLFLSLKKKRKKENPGWITKNVEAFLLKSPNVENDCRVPVTANQINVAL